MEDSVWSTAREGPDFDNPSFLLVSYEHGMFCQIEEDDDQQAAVVPVPPSTVPPLKKGGRPLASIPEYPDRPDSEKEDTDPDTLLVEDSVVGAPVAGTGEAIPCQCPVCDQGLPSGMALFRHLRSVHLTGRPYCCDDCDHKFNNLKELSSHWSRTHRSKKVACTQCNYRTTMKAKMNTMTSVRLSTVLNVTLFTTLLTLCAYTG